MVTLTQRHDKGQSLADLWDANGYAWGKVTSGRGWEDDKESFGVAGWVRVVEGTHGWSFGWHVHVHALVFFDGGGQVDPVGIGARMFQRWRSALMRKGLAAPLAGSGGLDVRMVGAGDAQLLGDYFAKNTYRVRVDAAGAGWEVAAGTQKKAKNGNRTPFTILADVVVNGEARDLDLWHEWEQASHGRRQLTWSKGLRAMLVPDADLDDDTIAALDVGGDVLVLVDAEGWRLVCARRLIAPLVAAVEQDDDGTAVIALLIRHGIPWRLPGADVPI